MKTSSTASNLHEYSLDTNQKHFNTYNSKSGDLVINPLNSSLIYDLIQKANNEVKIAFPTRIGYLFFEIGSIIRCKSDNSYTNIYLIDKTEVLLSRPLYKCEILLHQYGFFRINKSNLINLKYIKEFIRGNVARVKMIDNKEIDLSKERKNEFLSLLIKL